MDEILNRFTFKNEKPNLSLPWFIINLNPTIPFIAFRCRWWLLVLESKGMHGGISECNLYTAR